MSFFRKLIGRETAEELEASAEASAAEGQLGTAKLQLERALERLPAGRSADAERLRGRIVALRDGLARGRIDEAKRLFEEGEISAAIAEAGGAAEVAADPALVDEARRVVARIRTQAVVSDAAPPKALTHDEVLGAVTASWTDAQSEEYEALGELALEASVALELGRFEEAKEGFEEALAASEAPAWLHRDLARARWASGNAEGADDAFVAFFEAVTGEENDRALFDARLDHARLLVELARPEDALAEVEAALDHAGESPLDYVAVARFLRELQHAAEALDVLEAATSLPGAESNVVLQIEIALAESDLGKDEVALARLERVALVVRQQGYDAPREVEAARARLLERVGRAEHAAELHRRLALAGVDAFAFEHALEAARLHRELGRADEAERLLARAALLAEGDADKAAKVEAARAALDAP